jgi:hypothetical protein
MCCGRPRFYKYKIWAGSLWPKLDPATVFVHDEAAPLVSAVSTNERPAESESPARVGGFWDFPLSAFLRSILIPASINVTFFSPRLREGERPKYVLSVHLIYLRCFMMSITDVNIDHSPSQFTTNQPPQAQVESNFGDSSEPLFAMYTKIAEEEDNKMVESWQKDADGILIFVSHCIDMHAILCINCNILDRSILCHSRL